MSDSDWNSKARRFAKSEDWQLDEIVTVTGGFKAFWSVTRPFIWLAPLLSYFVGIILLPAVTGDCAAVGPILQGAMSIWFATMSVSLLDDLIDYPVDKKNRVDSPKWSAFDYLFPPNPAVERFFNRIQLGTLYVVALGSATLCAYLTRDAVVLTMVVLTYFPAALYYMLSSNHSRHGTILFAILNVVGWTVIPFACGLAVSGSLGLGALPWLFVFTGIGLALVSKPPLLASVSAWSGIAFLLMGFASLFALSCSAGDPFCYIGATATLMTALVLLPFFRKRQSGFKEMHIRKAYPQLALTLVLLSIMIAATFQHGPTT